MNDSTEERSRFKMMIMAFMRVEDGGRSIYCVGVEIARDEILGWGNNTQSAKLEGKMMTRG